MTPSPLFTLAQNREKIRETTQGPSLTIKHDFDRRIGASSAPILAQSAA
jgi:hypothetical protein